MRIKKPILILMAVMFMFLFNINITANAAVKIKSIDNINTTVKQGENYTLPKTVTATYSNKSKKAVAITWNPNSVNTSKPGNYTFSGTVKGYSKKVVLKVNVVAYITGINDINVTIKQNEKYVLPTTVSATYSDKTQKNLAVTWNVKSISTGTVGTFTYTGTVAGYAKKITLKLNIIMPKLTVQEISKKSSSVVTVTVVDRNGSEISFGSGFITSADGELVTNYHVIDGVYSAYVMMEDGKKYNVKGMLASDAAKDIAVLKLENAVNLQALSLGDSNKVEKAEDVIAIGSPKGYENTISTGIVSGLNRVSDIREGKDIQITAAIDRGSSGGALFNMYGQVIGMTYAGYDTGSLGFAIPVNDIKPLLGKKNIISFSSVDKASIPTALTATAVSDSEIQVQWNKVEGAEYYYLYYSDSADGKYYSYADEDGYKIMLDRYPNFSAGIFALDNNTTIYFKVTAIKSGIESDFSNVAYATTSDTITMNFLPLLTEVPAIPGYIFEKQETGADGREISYYYNTSSMAYSPVLSYCILLERFGWEYHGYQPVSSEEAKIYYTKGSYSVEIIIKKDYIVIKSNRY